MIISKFLKVNEPNVVHETIDGEAILLDLNTGNYFSLDGAGAAIWDYIAAKGDWSKAIELMTGENPGQKETIAATVEKFIKELIEEKLLVPVNDGALFSSEKNENPEAELKNAAVNFKAPVVNKYSDMQDLLLLDPIHDVDEKGWPEAQDIPPKEPEQ
jgi:hypothetical protein